MTNRTDTTLVDALRRFLRREQAVVSSSQYAATSQALRLFNHFLQNKLQRSLQHIQLTDLNNDWGREYLEYLQETVSVETEHLYTRSLLRFYQFMQEEYISALDLEGLLLHITAHRRTKNHTIPDIPADALDEILSYAQHFTLSSNIEPESRVYLQYLRDKAYILTLYDTGLRLSEMCSLRVNQMNTSLESLHVAPDLQLPISTSTAASLRFYLRERNRRLPNFKEGPLFARHDKRAGSHLLAISRWTGANIVTFWVQQALPFSLQHDLEVKGQAITTNTFRHYFVQRNLARNHSLVTIQKIARHTDIGTTRRYLKTLPDSVEPTDE